MGNGSVDTAALRSAVRRLAGGFSVEITPKETSRLADAAQVLAPGTSVYLTHLPNSDLDNVLVGATRVRALGLRPVVHLAARALPDMSAVDRALGQLIDHGVSDLLLIAGSIPRPVGTIDNTLQILESSALQRREFASIGVAGHPEGNPGVDRATVDHALARKSKLAAEVGLPLHVVTQFCFAPEPIVEWEGRMREAGVDLPVHVGLPGLTSPAKLIKFGVSCGIGPSLTVLRKQAGNVFKLATQVYRPAETLVGLAGAVATDPQSLIAAVHFFPFGAVAPTGAWATAIGDGRFGLGEDGVLLTEAE